MISHVPITLRDEHVLVATDHYLIVNKEPGWPVQATRDPKRPHLEGAVSVWLGESVSAAHRLDVWTSGVVLLARTAEARTALATMFEQRRVRKHYEAICVGTPDPRHGRLKHYLAKKRESGRDVMRSVRSGGRVAVTNYRTIGVSSVDGRARSLVWLEPVTGRTHQLRVQTAEAGWPILGDRHYGVEAAEDLPGQLLHARSLRFDDPFTDQTVFVETSPPALFQQLAESLQPERA